LLGEQEQENDPEPAQKAAPLSTAAGRNRVLAKPRLAAHVDHR